MLCGKFIYLALVCVCSLRPINGHFFSMRFFLQLIPQKRISNVTVGKTEAASVTVCNLKCINQKPCLSTLFTLSKKRCVLLKSFFEEVKEFGVTTEKNKSTKVIESRSKVGDVSIFKTWFQLRNYVNFVLLIKEWRGHIQETFKGRLVETQWKVRDSGKCKDLQECWYTTGSFSIVKRHEIGVFNASKIHLLIQFH